VAQVSAAATFFLGVRAYTGNGRSEPSVHSATRTVRVVVAEDESLFVEALEALLELEERIEVVARAHDGLEALRLVATLRPDVILMDLDMPRINGIGATRRITADYPFTQVVIVTASNEQEDVERAREAGAAAYITKDRVATDLAETLVEIALVEAAL
jgi:DNA-binding NarL/FixJ family response regulator